MNSKSPLSRSVVVVEQTYHKELAKDKTLDNLMILSYKNLVIQHMGLIIAPKQLGAMSI